MGYQYIPVRFYSSSGQFVSCKHLKSVEMKFWTNMCLIIVNLTSLEAGNYQKEKSTSINDAYLVRLPKWLSNPPQFTNIPFLPPDDIGQKCEVGGSAGVCTQM